MDIRVIKACSFCLREETQYSLPCTPGTQVAIDFRYDYNHQCRYCQAFGYIIFKVSIEQAPPVVE
jgi:hypothetical protein